jgi:Spy/CpxP family protein refolding chaperone
LKRRWPIYLLIFSLALNVGTAGALAFLRFQDRQKANATSGQQPMPLKDLCSPVKVDTAQLEAIKGLLPEHKRRLLEIRRELAQKRRELVELIASKAHPDSTIQEKVQEISNLQGSLEEEIVRFLLEVKHQLKPEQQAAFLSLVQRRLSGHGGLGHHFGTSNPGHVGVRGRG